MVEGHQCHRVGAAHRRLLLGRSFIATSPNGRFAEGAAAITGKLLTRIEVHGKNLFYFFTGGSSNSSTAATGSSSDKSATAAAAAAADHIMISAVDEDQIAQQAEASTVKDESLGVPAAAAAVSPEVPPLSPKTPAKLKTPGLLHALGAAAAAAVTPPPHSSTPPSSSAAAAAAAAAFPATPAAAAVTPGSSTTTPTLLPSDTVVVHIHFGMSGAFRTAMLPGPEPTPTTRLRLEHHPTGLMAHLSAMTVAHGGQELYQEKVSKLGPDPLRPDDDPLRFWSRVSSSKKPIGLLLMDQSAVAGVGNIYRAEILYKSRLHPEQPGYSITRQQFDVLWQHCVECLERGFRSGSILTVDPEDAKMLGKPWTRRYIYNQRQCGRCKGPVKSWDMAGRTVYCCDTCQPLQLSTDTAAAAAAAVGGRRTKKRSTAASSDSDTAAPPTAAADDVVLSPARLKSMAAAKQAKEFVSHCAPDDPSDLQPSKMTCQQLRHQLVTLNLNTKGSKPELVARLEAAVRWMAVPDKEQSAAAAAAAAAAEVVDLTAAAAAAAAAGGSSGSEDGVDAAEDRLAENLSVTAVKRRRLRKDTQSAAAEVAAANNATKTAAAAAGGSSDVPVTPQPASARRRRQSRTASAAAEAAGAAMASASAAAAEKAAAGENRAVEHVALHADDLTEAMMFGNNATQQQQNGVEKAKQRRKVR